DVVLLGHRFRRDLFAVAVEAADEADSFENLLGREGDKVEDALLLSDLGRKHDSLPDCGDREYSGPAILGRPGRGGQGREETAGGWLAEYGGMTGRTGRTGRTRRAGGPPGSGRHRSAGVFRGHSTDAVRGQKGWQAEQPPGSP